MKLTVLAVVCAVGVHSLQQPPIFDKQHGFAVDVVKRGSYRGKVSPDSTCGSKTGYTCTGSGYGDCCSQWGWCGWGSDYCGTGCQPWFGDYCWDKSPVKSVKPSGAKSSIKGTSVKTSSPSSPSDVKKTTTSGKCGKHHGLTCAGYGWGDCCSSYGWCGSSQEYCGDGCQSGYGKCGKAKSSSTKASSKRVSTSKIFTSSKKASSSTSSKRTSVSKSKSKSSSTSSVPTTTLVTYASETSSIASSSSVANEPFSSSAAPSSSTEASTISSEAPSSSIEIPSSSIVSSSSVVNEPFSSSVEPSSSTEAPASSSEAPSSSIEIPFSSIESSSSAALPSPSPTCPRPGVTPCGEVVGCANGEGFISQNYAASGAITVQDCLLFCRNTNDCVVVQHGDDPTYDFSFCNTFNVPESRARDAATANDPSCPWHWYDPCCIG